ncbi:hypothetical protein [Amycolatopsis australiensis]|uniref:Uncharacterized protein n=1 Tax=Amycolatopsis australiensis TaxID=546364 RepID=A0A1K1S164_9PSEU|nr:hypothetical protein [Amycolatopsis australiensis]SFW78099.1 hypothetical protein SAMN04489730_4441 [Amycolatopsis australiensis]
MSTSRHRAPAAIDATLAAAARDIHAAVRRAGPDDPPGLARLRETGWQLIQLTGGLSDLTALVAEHTSRHAEHPGRLRQVEAGPAGPQLARAVRELARLRQALDAANAAARDFYTATSHLAPAGPTP